MTVKELREKLVGLPDDMPVLREYDTCYEDDVVLYRTSAERSGRGWLLEGDWLGPGEPGTLRDVLIIGPDRCFVPDEDRL